MRIRPIAMTALLAAALFVCGCETVTEEVILETSVWNVKNSESTAATQAVQETLPAEALPAETLPEETMPEETTPEETTPEETLPVIYVSLPAETEPAAAETGSGSGNAVPGERPVIIGVKYCQKDGVNIRHLPITTSDVLGGLSRGDQVQAIAEENGWWMIWYEDSICYVKAEYLGDTAPAPAETAAAPAESAAASDYETKKIGLNDQWKYADFSKIHSGKAVLYKAETNRRDIVIGVNAGHGTKGGSSVKTWCHPDKTPKVTGGTTEEGATKAIAVSSGMDFDDGTAEAKVTLKQAQILRDMLLQEGYDVLMLRDGSDVQLDNVARTVICNNAADCHIALHWDGDGLNYDKGCFYMSVPKALKKMEPVASNWEDSEALGQLLIKGLKDEGLKILKGGGEVDMDLTQTSYSTVPSVDIELGNQCSDHSEAVLKKNARGLVKGINRYFGN